MEACNAYYYATRDPLGAAGDFTTAPEIHQMFGELVGAALADVLDARRQARPTPSMPSLGRDAGRWPMMRCACCAALASRAKSIWSKPARRCAKRRQNCCPTPGSMTTSARCPTAPLLLVANEFFDALADPPIGRRPRAPCHPRRRRFRVRPRRPDRRNPRQRGRKSPSSSRSDLASHGGAAIIIDYGYAGGEQGDTLQAVRGHRFSYVLDHPGEQDLTAHVDFAALAEAARRGGARGEPRRQPGDMARNARHRRARDGAWRPRTQRIRRRIAAARRRLCDEEQMGRLFKVMAIRAPDWPEVAGLEA